MSIELSTFANAKIADMASRGFSAGAIASAVQIDIARAKEGIEASRAKEILKAEAALDKARTRTFQIKLKALRDAAAAEKAAAEKVKLDPSNVSLTVAEIVAATAVKHGLRVSDLKSMRRLRKVAHARQEAAYLAFDLTQASLAMIGRVIGRDNSTIIFAIRQHAKRHGLPLPRGMKPEGAAHGSNS